MSRSVIMYHKVPYYKRNAGIDFGVYDLGIRGSKSDHFAPSQTFILCHIVFAIKIQSCIKFV